MTRVKYEKEKVRLLPFLIIGLLLFVLYSCFIELCKTTENIIGNIVVISIGIIGIVLTIIWTIKINRERKNFIKNNLKIKEHGEKIVTDSIIINHKLVEMSNKHIRRYFFDIKYNYNGEEKQYKSPIITIMNDKDIIKPINVYIYKNKVYAEVYKKKKLFDNINQELLSIIIGILIIFSIFFIIVLLVN